MAYTVLLRCYPKVTDFIYLFFDSAPWADYRFLPVFSYGFFVAMGFLAAASLATLEMKRREALGLMRGVEIEVTVGETPKPAELVFYFLFGFILLFKAGGFITYQPDLSTGALSLGDYMRTLTAGSWIAGILGGVALAGYYYYTKNKEKLPKPVVKKILHNPSDQVGDLVVIAAIFGVLGSNFFNFLENPDDYKNFWQDPVGSMFSGLSVYGGLICAGAAFAVYARLKKISVAQLFDSVAPGFILANGIGRIGCHVSGDGDWGIVNTAPNPGLPDWFWAYSYEHNIIDEGVPIANCMEQHCYMLPQPVYPTPIYELLMCTAIFFVLWALRKKLTQVPYMLFFVFTILIGIQRYTIEQFRDLSGRQPYHILGGDFKQSELISIALIIIGIAGVTYLWRKHGHLLLKK